MAAFRFAAADGSGKEQNGVLEADSARAARQLLRGRGLIPLTVEPVFDEIASASDAEKFSMYSVVAGINFDEPPPFGPFEFVTGGPPSDSDEVVINDWLE